MSSMGEPLLSLAEILEIRDRLPESEFHDSYSNWTLAATALLLHQQGSAEASNLLADVVTLRLTHTDTDWDIAYYEASLEVEPHLVSRFTKDVNAVVLQAMEEVTSIDVKREISEVRARPLIPRVSEDWRKHLKAESGPKQSNQARRVRLEPDHPFVDGLHLTNEWEYGVYLRLKERQAKLPDNETIGIIPLPGMRVLGHNCEPDFLITYKGQAGVIEVDGPHHKDRASADKSRERLLRNAGIKYIDRLDVRDTTRDQVEKFITDFLKHLAA